ncbi:hypothetical protein BT63DRAFT_460273 [Microthyrium microscopicum]|uniref:TAZ-type domain-containing protein n=1 Tax=Microthyrium microscopicum TaxID=703497 RepID=A0A6A6U0K5_9PEZI|nr:hypothetical protein BT63DRAFT_460273 [Microthyrium microscopicum]
MITHGLLLFALLLRTHPAIAGTPAPTDAAVPAAAGNTDLPISNYAPVPAANPPANYLEVNVNIYPGGGVSIATAAPFAPGLDQPAEALGDPGQQPADVPLPGDAQGVSISQPATVPPAPEAQGTPAVSSAGSSGDAGATGAPAASATDAGSAASPGGVSSGAPAPATPPTPAPTEAAPSSPAPADAPSTQAVPSSAAPPPAGKKVKRVPVPTSFAVKGFPLVEKRAPPSAPNMESVTTDTTPPLAKLAARPRAAKKKTTTTKAPPHRAPMGGHKAKPQKRSDHRAVDIGKDHSPGIKLSIAPPRESSVPGKRDSAPWRHIPRRNPENDAQYYNSDAEKREVPNRHIVRNEQAAAKEIQQPGNEDDESCEEDESSQNVSSTKYVISAKLLPDKPKNVARSPAPNPLPMMVDTHPPPGKKPVCSDECAKKMQTCNKPVVQPFKSSRDCEPKARPYLDCVKPKFCPQCHGCSECDDGMIVEGPHGLCSIWQLDANTQAHRKRSNISEVELSKPGNATHSPASNHTELLSAPPRSISYLNCTTTCDTKMQTSCEKPRVISQRPNAAFHQDICEKEAPAYLACVRQHLCSQCDSCLECHRKDNVTLHTTSEVCNQWATDFALFKDILPPSAKPESAEHEYDRRSNLIIATKEQQRDVIPTQSSYEKLEEWPAPKWGPNCTDACDTQMKTACKKPLVIFNDTMAGHTVSGFHPDRCVQETPAYLACVRQKLCPQCNGCIECDLQRHESYGQPGDVCYEWHKAYRGKDSEFYN